MAENPIHPDLRTIARFVPRGATGPRLLRVTRTFERLTSRRKTPAGITVETAAGVEVRVHRPSNGGDDARPAVLWTHGGGYVIGHPSQDDALCRVLATRLGAVVAAVVYRRAPEHPYPAALDDCYAALTWLSEQPGVDATRVAVAGASAGGGLAAALSLRARDRGDVRLAFQSLAYPMLDDRTTLRTGIDERHYRLWNNKANRFGWRSYLGLEPGSADIAPTAAPARRDDLSGLPAAWIGVGTLDLFHDEDLAYAERLRAAGVPCSVDVVEGAFHGFDLIRPNAGVSRAFRDAQVVALASAFDVR